MSTELGEFFSLIGKARQEKEEEFQSLVGEINIDSLFAEVKTSVAEDKKKKKKKLEEDKKKKAKEKRQVKALESWLYSEPKDEEKLEIEDANGDVAFEVVDLITPEPLKPSEPVVEEQEEPEEISEETEEIPEDTVDHALKILETIKSKEEVQENVGDPEIIKIRGELEYLKNLVNAQGGGGEVRLEFLDDVDRDSAKVDGKFLKYDSATGKFIGADASGGGGGSGSITIKDEGSTVGTAGSVTSIDFVGDNITASASGVGATITFSDTPQFDSLNITGLSTFSDITVSGQLNDLTIPSGSGTIAKTSDVPDTSTLMPKSGGTFTGDITLSNGEYLNLGDTNTFLGNTGSQILFRFGSDIKLQGNTFFFQNEGGTYEFMRLSTTFGTQLKYQGFTKLTVDSTGITVNGQLNDLTIPSGSGTIAITDDIPTNNNELTNGAGYITTSFTNTNQLTNGAGFITASDNITGTAAGLSGSPNINVSAVTATSGEFSGNVTIGGTLTYEDVTSIDSVGLVTARQGINVNGGQIIVGSAFSVGQAGVVTASSFVGNLTGSATSLSGVSSSFLLDYNNFTNTPTIPTNNNELTNGAGFITASDDITGTAAGLSGTPNITVGIVTATSVIVGSAVTINSSGLNVLGVVTATTFDGNLAFSNITGISTDIVGDTTPQLGGNLDLNSNDITGTGDFNVTGVITATSFHGDGSKIF